jgi:hypothetical protein
VPKTVSVYGTGASLLPGVPESGSISRRYCAPGDLLMDPTIILTSLLPLIIDGVKSAIGHFTGNKPAITNADDYAKVTDSDIKKLEALAKLDSPNGDTSKWVNNLKSLQRITVVYLVLFAWITGTFIISMPDDRYKLLSDLAGAVFFYLFGDRVNFYAQKR